MSFKETQHFTQKWLWGILILATVLPVVLFGAAVYSQVIMGKPFGNNPMSDNGLIIPAILISLLMVGTLVLSFYQIFSILSSVLIILVIRIRLLTN